MSSSQDTIAAPASAPGPGLRSIIRVSGVDCRPVLESCFTPDDAAAWNAAVRPQRHAGRLHLPGFSAGVAAAVHLWPTARSYSGEPLAEMHLPGSPPLVSATLAAVYAAGARPARAGEFTLRAFLAGRLDLLQAEAVLGVIDAEDHVQLQAALTQLAGGASRRIADLREQLLLDLADLEAGLDFVDEAIEFVSRADLQRRLSHALGILRELQRTAAGRLQSTGRRRVVLAGLPNAGKSSLFNVLAGESAALVSPRPGTTRDVLRAIVDWDGTTIELCDTAGWDDALEQAADLDRAAGLLRSEELSRAALIVWCTPLDLLTDQGRQNQMLRRALTPDAPVVDVWTKSDLPNASLPPPGLAVSALTGAGLPELRTACCAAINAAAAHHGELLATTAARCLESLRLAEAALANAFRTATDDPSVGDELISVDLREGLLHLGMICGAVYTDDLLDRIFSRFCIGK